MDEFAKAGNQMVQINTRWAIIEAILVSLACIPLFLIKFDIIEYSGITEEQKNSYAIIALVIVAIEWLWALYILKGKYGQGLALQSGVGGGPLTFILVLIYSSMFDISMRL